MTRQNRLAQKRLDEFVSVIQALDLESVKLRLTDAEPGEGWSREYADNIAAAYKRYLVMQGKYCEDAEDVLLAKDVDEFWHTHRLQTRQSAIVVKGRDIPGLFLPGERGKIASMPG